jgi:hypothetical protein
MIDIHLLAYLSYIMLGFSEKDFGMLETLDWEDVITNELRREKILRELADFDLTIWGSIG